MQNVLHSARVRRRDRADRSQPYDTSALKPQFENAVDQVVHPDCPPRPTLPDLRSRSRGYARSSAPRPEAKKAEISVHIDVISGGTERITQDPNNANRPNVSHRENRKPHELQRQEVQIRNMSSELGPRRKRFTRLRMRSERGASLVEGAIVAPIFFAMLFMVFEGSFMLRSYLSTARAGDEGDRTATITARDSLADFMTIQSVKSALAGLDTDNIEYVIVYKANKVGDDAPDACRTGSVVGLCNHYTSIDLNLGENFFGCGTGTKDVAWCPTTRKVGLAAGPDGPPDLVGVQVAYVHKSLVGLFFDEVTVKSHSVGRIEPQTK